jgi:hypothetical protein
MTLSAFPYSSLFHVLSDRGFALEYDTEPPLSNSIINQHHRVSPSVRIVMHLVG